MSQQNPLKKKKKEKKEEEKAEVELCITKENPSIKVKKYIAEIMHQAHDINQEFAVKMGHTIMQPNA